jgi:peptide/nickel transport system substrate-binding protein
MKKKFIWLAGSLLILLPLILAACSTTTISTTTTGKTTASSMSQPVTTTSQAPSTTTVVSTPNTATAKPQYGGTFTIVLAAEQRGFDSDLLGWSGMNLGHQTDNTLIQGDWAKGPSGDYTADFDTSTPTLSVNTGALAESWELTGLDTIIYHIRHGVNWGLNNNSEASRLVGGRELTAEDVAFTLRRQFNIEPTLSIPKAYALTRMTLPERPTSVVATDKYTVVVKGNAGYIGSLFYWTGEMVGINAPEVVQKYEDLTNAWNTVGTGGFMINDYVQNSSLTVIKNPNYWEKDPYGLGKGNQLPYLDSVRYLVIPDPSTQLAAFRTGKIDLMRAVSLDDYQVLIKNNPALLSKKLIGDPNGLAYRVDNPAQPWYDLRVRQALQLGLDRQTIVKDYYQGQAEVLAFPVAPRQIFKKLGVYRDLNTLPADVQALFKYDPVKAKQLLADAGYPNGFSIQVILQQSQIDEASLLKSQLAKIGVTLNLSVQEVAVYTSISTGRTHKEGIFVTGLGNTPHAFHNFRPTDSGNPSYINDATVNKAIDNFSNYFMIDDSKAWPIIGDLTPYVLQQSWYLQLPAAYTWTTWWPWVKNYNGEYSLGAGHFYSYPKYIWIDQNAKKAAGY